MNKPQTLYDLVNKLGEDEKISEESSRTPEDGINHAKDIKPNRSFTKKDREKLIVELRDEIYDKLSATYDTWNPSDDETDDM
jgi:hypothetical protein